MNHQPQRGSNQIGKITSKVPIMEAFLKTGKLGPEAAGGSRKSGQTTKRRGPVPWVEKYRPKTVDEVAYQDEVVAVLKKALGGADLPNLLFYGPPGTGKTSTILAIARDLFGDIYRERILELNASDDRGISVVREKVKSFARFTVSGKRADGRPCPPYKIIILDEADSMTKDAQSALRRTMEKEGRSTKFCLICNYVSRIIEPLTSRCAKFRFKLLSQDVMTTRIQMIAGAESLQLSDDAMRALERTSEGDLRKAITTLQSCASLKGGDIQQADVYELSGVIPNDWIEKILTAMQSNTYEIMEPVLEDFMCEGFSVTQLIGQLLERLIHDDHLLDAQKSRICQALAVAEGCLLDGANEYLQLLDMCSTLMISFAMGA
eukprot:snap_masked-scaffold770_size100439-processed-gene-0.0 protein:Tk05387 transcript:snap_masked-scaffold770_size100439-processed-gene-0.0-mRNA-1 annotation:"replication factor c subunit 4"